MTNESERGGALILALLIAAALALIGAGLLASSVNTARVASNEQSNAHSLAIAEAGLERAKVAMATMPVNAVLGAGSTGTLYANQAFDSGSYNVVLSNNLAPRFPLGLVPADPGPNDTDGYFIITSTGSFATASRSVEVIMMKQSSVWNYAVWTNTSANFSGAGYTDSYDSSAGPYVHPGGQNANAFSNGDMTMSGSSMINGSATVGGTIDSNHVSGAVTTGAPPQSMPNLACPGGGYFPAASITGTSYTYDAANGKLNVSGGGDVTLTGPPYAMYFSEIVLSGSSTLTVSSGANHVDLYCAGKLDISGGTMVNPGAKPSLLNLAACGPGTQDWKVSGGSDAFFTVYAPTRDVTLSGTSPLYGAVIADTVTDSGGSMIHYDTSLSGNGIAAVPNSWTEVYK